VPAQLITENGLWPNKWLSVQRKAHEEGALTQYCTHVGSIAGMPQDYMAEHCGNLFNWVKAQKRRQKQGTSEP